MHRWIHRGYSLPPPGQRDQRPLETTEGVGLTVTALTCALKRRGLRCETCLNGTYREAVISHVVSIKRSQVRDAGQMVLLPLH